MNRIEVDKIDRIEPKRKKQTKQDQSRSNGPNRTKVDQSGQNGPNRTKVDIMDRIGLKWIEQDQYGLNRANVD